MKFGYFDDENREYVVETPATPLPWINYLGNQDFFGLISNTGGGYCFYRDAKLRRLIRYRYQNVPADMGGRFFYLREPEKTPWSPAFLPCGTALDRYRCRHGLGYTVFESEKDHLAASLTAFIPLHETCEVHSLTLKNNGKQEKEIELWGAVEWCLWNAADDAANFQRNLNTGEVETEPSVIYHTTEYRERRDHYAWFSVNTHTDGFETDRDEFLGPFGDWRAPRQVTAGQSKNSVAHGGAPIAAHRITLKLEPGEEARYVFLLGYAENPRDQKFSAPGVVRKDGARRVVDRFLNPAAADAALAELKSYWTELLSVYTVSSKEPRLDRMVNIWNQYQCMVTFNMSRSASYFESGMGRGMGFRDSCQDLLGFVHLIPDRARERILDIAAVQKPDGSTYHQYQPLTKRGNNDIGSGFNDDPLWLVAAVCAYLRETGDFSILEELVPFDSRPGSEAPLLEHLRCSVHFTMNHLGPHGLPLIGRADWNDCLNLNCFSEEPGESFQVTGPSDGAVAESVFIAGMFVKYGREYADLCRRLKLGDEAARVDQAVADMEKAVLTDGWDGAWYLRAYDAAGNPVGGESCTEGQIFIEPQGFCAMAGIGGAEGRPQKALDSVRKHLLGDYGVELLTPCYTAYHKELGEITSYPPGYKENGSVFCHNNPWLSIAETELGRGEEAFDVYRRICPAWVEERSEIHRTEPYVYSQTVAGRAAARPGEAKNSWLTGTSAWSFVNISQAILGIQPDYDGLRIRPCLPRELGELTVCRRFRGVDYTIHIRNGGGHRPQLRLNGLPLAGDLVPLPPEGVKTCHVEVRL